MTADTEASGAGKEAARTLTAEPDAGARPPGVGRGDAADAGAGADAPVEGGKGQCRLEGRTGQQPSGGDDVLMTAGGPPHPTSSKLEVLEQPAGLQEEFPVCWEGHDMCSARGRPEHALTVYIHNLDGCAGPHQLRRDIHLARQCGASALCFQDTQWHAARLSEMKDALRREWCSEMRLYHDINSTEGAVRHGVGLAIADPWIRRVAKVVRDERGWARFIGAVIQGTSGALALFSVYVPCAGSKDETWQEARLDSISAEDRQSSALEQLFFDLSKVVAALRRLGVSVCFTGDFNLTWDLRTRANLNPQSPRAASRTRLGKEWAEATSLHNVYQCRHPRGAVTYALAGVEDDKDMVLAEAPIAETAQVGVVDHKRTGAFCSSHHWPLVFTVDLDLVIGVDGESIRCARATADGSRLVWADKEGRERYCKAAKRTWRKLSLGEQVARLVDRTEEEGTVSEAQWRKLDSLLTRATEALVATERGMHRQHRRKRRRKRAEGKERPEVARLRSILALARRYSRAVRRVDGPGARTAAGSWYAFDAATAATARATPADASQVHDVERRGAILAATQALRRDKSMELSRLNSKLARGSLRAYTERTRRFSTQLDTGRLNRAVSERQLRGSGYASVARMVDEETATGAKLERDSDAKAQRFKVTSDPKGVASLLVEHFAAWFSKPEAWYHDAPINALNKHGRALREQLARKGEEFDLAGSGMPERFAYMRRYLKRVPGATEELYKDVLDPISEEEWREHWKKVGKDKAPGRSGLTVNMVAALPPEILEDLRELINVGQAAGRMGFSTWKRRVMCPVAKELGNPDLAKARPLCLLEVLMKAYWAIMGGRISKIWESNGLLQPQQFGFRPGRSTTEPLLLATLVAERQHELNEAFYALLQDVSQAYDSVAYGIGKDMALRRLGVPEEVIDLFHQMDEDHTCAVATAYGYSDVVLGEEEGLFSFRRGWCQGDPASPLGWDAFYDILLAMQNDMERITEDLVQCRGDTFSGAAYADDAAWFATGPRGLELRYNAAALFLDFAEINSNPKKQQVFAAEWRPNPSSGASTLCDVALDAEPWRLRRYKPEALFKQGRLNVLPASESPRHLRPAADANDSVGLKLLATGARYLGALYSPRVHPEESVRQLRTKVWGAEWAIRTSRLSAAAADFMMNQVLWAQIGFRLRFERVPEAEIHNLEGLARTTWLRRHRHGPTMSRDLVGGDTQLGGMGWSRWYDRLMIDRVGFVLRRLQDEGSYCHKLILAGVERLQERSGSARPVFEDPLAADHGWLVRSKRQDAEAGFLGTLARWCASRNVQLRGFPGLTGAAGPDDCALVDLVDTTGNRKDLRTEVQRWCDENDVWFVSQLLSLAGTIPPSGQLPARGYMASVVRGALAKAPRAARLPRYRVRHEARVGDVCFVQEEDGDALRLAVVVDSTPGTASARVLRQRLPSRLEAGVRCEVLRGGIWLEGTILGVPPAEPPSATPGDTRWVETSDGVCVVPATDVRPYCDVERSWASAVEWTTTREDVWCPTGEVFHLCRRRIARLPCKRGLARLRERERYYVDVTADDVRLLLEAGTVSPSDAAPVASRGGAPGGAALAPGHGADAGASAAEQLEAVRGRCRDLTRLQPKPRWGQRPAILVSSDGTVKMGEGGWGLVIAVPGQRVPLMECGHLQGGRGSHGKMTSYRTEGAGVLAGMRAVAKLDTDMDVYHNLDNLSIVNFCNNPARVPVAAADLLEEIRYWQRELGPRYKVVWTRGHPERRKHPRAFTPVDCGNVCADALAALGRVSGGADIRHSLQHGQRFHVCVGGERCWDRVENVLRQYICLEDIDAYATARRREAVTPDAWVNREFARTKSSIDRAWRTRFRWDQAATRCRMAGLYGGRTRGATRARELTRCRFCGAPGEDKLEHLMVCRDARPRQIMADWLYGFRQLLRPSPLGPFFKEWLTLREGVLRGGGEVARAAQFLMGWWPQEAYEVLAAAPDPAEEEAGGHAAQVLARAGRHWLQNLCRPLWSLCRSEEMQHLAASDDDGGDDVSDTLSSSSEESSVAEPQETGISPLASRPWRETAASARPRRRAAEVFPAPQGSGVGRGGGGRGGGGRGHAGTVGRGDGRGGGSGDGRRRRRCGLETAAMSLRERLPPGGPQGPGGAADPRRGSAAGREWDTGWL